MDFAVLTVLSVCFLLIFPEGGKMRTDGEWGIVILRTLCLSYG